MLIIASSRASLLLCRKSQGLTMRSSVTSFQNTIFGSRHRECIKNTDKMCRAIKIARMDTNIYVIKRLLSRLCYFLGSSDIWGHQSLAKHRPSQQPHVSERHSPHSQQGPQVREELGEGVWCSLEGSTEKFGQLTNLRWKLRSQSTSPHSAPEDRTRDSVKQDLQVKVCKHQGKGLLITLSPKWSTTFPHFYEYFHAYFFPQWSSEPDFPMAHEEGIPHN